MLNADRSRFELGRRCLQLLRLLRLEYILIWSYLRWKQKAVMTAGPDSTLWRCADIYYVYIRSKRVDKYILYQIKSEGENAIEKLYIITKLQNILWSASLLMEMRLFHLFLWRKKKTRPAISNLNLLNRFESNFVKKNIIEIILSLSIFLVLS